MFSLFTLALEQHIRFANSICFGLNFLSKQMDGNLLSPASCQCQQAFLCDSEHTTGSTGSVYQSGVFDTGKYGRKYGKSPISKDFRGFLASSEVLISVGLIRLSVYAIPETENATRLFGLSCSDMGLSCISMFAHHASLKGYAIMLQILLMLNAL